MFYSIYSVTLHFDKFHDTAVLMWIIAYSYSSFEGHEAINEMQEALESARALNK